MILAIDTSQMRFSLALSNGESCFWENPSLTIYDQLDKLIANDENIEKIAICTGPGRFSGLRSGLAFCKGFARTRSIPIYAFDAFSLYASCINDDQFTIIIDARKNEAYAQTFNAGVASPIELLDQEAIEAHPSLYGNIPPAKSIAVNANTLLTVCQHHIRHNGQPSEPNQIEAIYIRPSVD